MGKMSIRKKEVPEQVQGDRIGGNEVGGCEAEMAENKWELR